MKRLFVFTFWALILQSCVAPSPTTQPKGKVSARPSAAVFESYAYGATPTNAKLLQVLKDWGYGNMKDPYSAKYAITQPARRGWGKTKFFNGVSIPGWLFKASYNSKNGYGAYAGTENHVWLLHNGKLKQLTVAHSGRIVGSTAEGKSWGYQ